MASLRIVGSGCDLVSRRHTFVLSGITRLVSSDRTKGYDFSYRSFAYQPLWEFPYSHSEHSTFLPVSWRLSRLRKPN